MHILITGGTGLLGKRLTSYLLEHAMHPRIVSRSTNDSADISQYEWNVDEGRIDPDAFTEVDTVIHLAGANIAEGRWNTKRKEEILSSRIRSTRLLFESVKKINSNERPKTFICASATGYYGIHDFEHESREDDQAGEGFLAQVCLQWEKEADRFATLGMRVIKIRTGVVFDEKGGALHKMTQPIRYLMGSPLGSGKQSVCWIHWEDWCRAIHHFITHKGLSGSYNLVAPEPVTNAKLTRLIARIIKRPLWLPNVPGFMLKFLLGEMSTVVLEGHKMSSKKLEDAGYQFNFPAAEKAISDLLIRP
ncbi:TIGR01777 family oxidoreductase [Reichenbachiella sp.]|uniref:TIGR01777 family oxidoreductase n=1 Tax=Reichenbachiella sp. TaxID=2184521 RepID=UPI0032972124